MISCQCVRSRVCGCPPVPLVGIRRAKCLRDASQQSRECLCNSIAPRAAQTRSVGEAGVSLEQEQTWVPALHLSPKEGLIVSYTKDRLGALSAPQQHLCKAQRASATQGRAAWPDLPSGTSPGSSWDRPAGCWGDLRPHCLQDPREKQVWDRVFAVSGSVPHARRFPLGLGHCCRPERAPQGRWGVSPDCGLCLVYDPRCTCELSCHVS